MKKIYLLLISFSLIWSNVNSQSLSNNLMITECGEGRTEQEALDFTRKIALDQIIRVFTSNSSELINNTNLIEKLISDDSGIFISYEKMFTNVLPRGRYVVVIKYNVSLDKLKSAIQNFGITSTVDFNQFTIKIKRQLIEEQNEIRVIGDLIGLLHEPMQSSFDYEIISGTPQSTDSESKKWKIPLTAIAKTNKNIDLCADLFINTIKSICISENEIKDYAALNKSYYPLIIFQDGKEYNYYLKKDISWRALYGFQKNWEFYTRLFEVSSGIEVSYGNENLWNYTKLYQNKYADDPPDGEQIYEFNGSRIWNNQIQYIRFNFLTKNQNAAIYKWEDEKDMSQIEKMTGYVIKPLNIISYYYLGGYTVQFDSKSGHGFVVAPFDIGNYNWEEAKKVCNNLVVGGVSGWEMPSLNELELINLNIFRKGLMNDDILEHYWTSQQSDGTGSICFPKPPKLLSSPVICPYVTSFRMGWGSTELSRKEDIRNIRPIRRF